MNTGISNQSQDVLTGTAEQMGLGPIGMRNGFGLSGVPVDDVLMDEALQRIEEMIQKGGTHQVATANVDFLVHATKDPEYRRILCMCDLVVADGMPIVWASRLFGIPLRERVAGADMVPQLVRLAGLKGYTIFLLGATPEVAEAAERQMRILSPNVRVVGRLSPPVKPLDQFDNDSILAEIDSVKPDILLVAFGSPKQEKWISRNRHRLNVPVCIGIGGTLDFMAGTVKRAPMWMQKSGMEWLFRMCVDPQRLIPRYFNDAVWMVRYLAVQLAVHRASRQRQETLSVTLDSIGSVNIVSVAGAMAGSGLATLGKMLSSSVLSSRAIVLDLAATTHMGADGLWTLAGLLRHASQTGCEVWLAGLSQSLNRELRAAHFEGLFRSTASSLDAVRQISRGRLQISVELGENWAKCRIAGDLPPGARQTLEEICSSIRQTNEHFELDASGMAEFEPGNLLNSIRQPGKLVFVEAPRKQVAGAA
jgi:N-acetylglucosaminyldiphosphoundecaprenol N-acetyl-beta-D-mannosaminyltransferase